MSNRSSKVAFATNGLADKSSCHVLAQWQRKDFSRNSSYPLVSGSAEGTIRRSVAYRQPVSENRMQESPKGRCIRAVGIFANSSAKKRSHLITLHKCTNADWLCFLAFVSCLVR